MAPAALRIPSWPAVSQPPTSFSTGGPQIFVHEGVRQRLERRMEVAAAGPVQLAVTDNRRRMVTHTRERGTLRVRVHMMFLGAEERIQEALVRYVVHGDREASQVIGSFIDANNHHIRAAQPALGPLRAKGQVHDLAEILEEVIESYFGAAASNVAITWGRRTKPPKAQRQTIKLGSYSAIERLIRVHPVLDRDWVPRYFISHVVYHELLHHLLPHMKVGGRSVVHSPEFLRREREFRHHERAMAWERKHLDRLLRAR